MWFAEHSPAHQVLLDCVERDAGRVWQVMQPYVSTPTDALMFSIGFPREVADRMPPGDLTAWVAEKPAERAPVIARLASNDFSTDDTIVSQVLGAYLGYRGYRTRIPLGVHFGVLVWTSFGPLGMS